MLIRAYGHAQQMDEAWKIWRQMLADEKVLTEDIFMSMVDACLASSDMKSLLGSEILAARLPPRHRGVLLGCEDGYASATTGPGIGAL